MMVDLLPIVEGWLIGSLSVMSWLSWRQQRLLDELRARHVRARSATHRWSQWSRKVDFTEAVPEEIPVETVARIEVTERHAA